MVRGPEIYSLSKFPALSMVLLTLTTVITLPIMYLDSVILQTVTATQSPPHLFILLFLKFILLNRVDLQCC